MNSPPPQRLFVAKNNSDDVLLCKDNVSVVSYFAGLEILRPRTGPRFLLVMLIYLFHTKSRKKTNMKFKRDKMKMNRKREDQFYNMCSSDDNNMF